jgi:hypothetical protein
MGQKTGRLGHRGAARSRQDESKKAGEVGSKRTSSGGKGGGHHVWWGGLISRLLFLVHRRRREFFSATQEQLQRGQFGLRMAQTVHIKHILAVCLR